MAQMKKQKKSSLSEIKTKAKRLISDSRFLYKVGLAIRALGVIGERRLRSIMFLAAVTRNWRDKASVIVIGESASGKSTTVKKTLQLFPPSCVMDRTGISKQALFYGRGSLNGKILFLTELKSAQEAQFVIRQSISEGSVEREATNITRRNTKTVKRSGTPVVLTTATPSTKIHPDDLSRFLVAYTSDSSKQTGKIVTSQAEGKQSPITVDLAMWRAATSFLSPRKGDFENPPKWLKYVAKQLPLRQVRTRRDWPRFLAFLHAIAFCRPRPNGGIPLNICFADYCVGYQILEPVLAANITQLPTEDVQLGQAVAVLHRRNKRGVTAKELRGHLSWKNSAVYKHITSAVANRLIKYEPGTREKNEKRLLPRKNLKKGFLPPPKMVLVKNSEIGKKVKYVDPFTGKWRTVRR
jgi:hypothetical protein